MAESSSEIVVQSPKTTTLSLLQLPLEILIKIATFCSARTLASLSLCCRELNTLCTKGIVWKYIISYRYRDVSISLLLPDLSHRYLYRNYYYFLYPLRGLWVLHLNPCNIVLSIAQSPVNILEFIGKMPGLRKVEYISEPIQFHEIASFSLNSSSYITDKNHLTFSCSGQFEEGERINPLRSLRLSKTPSNNLLCEINTANLKGLRGRDRYSYVRYRILTSLYSTTSCELSLTKVVIKTVTTTNPQVLSPGVYTGDYSIHGIELLLVYYQDGMILVKKLAGDDNIPGDKISMRCPHLNTLDTSKPVYIDFTQGGVITCDLQPSLYPTRFIASYPGEGQLAYAHYTDPTFSTGTMYVADQSTFVFVWDELLSCSLVTRCEELSNQCEFI